MKRNTDGGFIARAMPPDNWNHGNIPDSCYDKSLSPREIEEKLLKVYKREENIKALMDEDTWLERLRVETAILIIAEIDSRTIYQLNQKTDHGI